MENNLEHLPELDRVDLDAILLPSPLFFSPGKKPFELAIIRMSKKKRITEFPIYAIGKVFQGKDVNSRKKWNSPKIIYSIRRDEDGRCYNIEAAFVQDILEYKVLSKL